MSEYPTENRCNACNRVYTDWTKHCEDYHLITTAKASKFTELLNEIQTLHDSKAHDYAKDSDRFSNFKEASAYSHVEVNKVFEVLLGIKQARLNELTSSGKSPNNESIRDTMLDRCVYSILALQFYDESNTK